MALYHLEFITKTHTRTHFLTYYLQRPWTPLTFTHKKHSFTYKLASLSSYFPICVPKEMDKKPTMKHNLHLTSVEGEPKTLTKEQYEIARVSLTIFALFVMRFLVQGIDSLALHIIYTPHILRFKHKNYSWNYERCAYKMYINKCERTITIFSFLSCLLSILWRSCCSRLTPSLFICRLQL